MKKRKKNIIIKRKTIIKIKASHLKDFARRRVLKEVVLVPVLLVEVLVPPHSGGVVVMVVLAFRIREALVVLVVHFAIDVTIDIVGSVGRVTDDVLLVARWDIGLFNVRRISRNLSHLACRHQFLSSIFQGLVVILKQVTVEQTIIKVISSYSGR